MLDFLVTSKVRRRILKLLFGDGFLGTAKMFAERACVSLPSTHRELLMMKRVGLVMSLREGDAAVFRANENHPHRAVFQALAKLSSASFVEFENAERVRAELRVLGAPLFRDSVLVSIDDSVEAALVRGVALAHFDGVVASILPVCIYKQRDALHIDRLTCEARLLGEEREIGFFLDLTSEISGDERFAEWSRMFQDARESGTCYFFSDEVVSQRARALADLHTPHLAKKWNLRMNASMDSFVSAFRKHVGEVRA